MNPPCGSQPSTSDPTRNRPLVPKGVTVFLAKSVQDAHTRAEQDIYQTMWNKGTPEEGCDNRLFQMGNTKLARLAGGSQRQLRRNIQSLQAKLSIEVICESQPLAARQYRVLHYGQILARRRTAGLEWVKRSRGSVNLVPSPEVRGGVTVTSLDTVTFLDTVTRGGGDTVTPLINQEHLNQERKQQHAAVPIHQPTPDLPKTTEEIHRKFPSTDVPFIQEIFSACRRAATAAGNDPQDVTDQLVAEAVKKSYRRTQESGGLYLKTVPPCVVTLLTKKKQPQAATLWEPAWLESASEEEKQNWRNQNRKGAACG
jgi:hypothetical protein